MTSPDRRRWPAKVYGVGAEPDPRFSLANERTFLAWIRTTLALLGVAVALDVIPLRLPGGVQQGVSALLALCAAATAVQAWAGWARTERAMRLGEPLPHAPMAFPVVLALLVVAVATLSAVAIQLWR